MTDYETWDIKKSLARFGQSFTPVGLAGAVFFFCASLTPSLVPRTWPYQALVSGLSLITGYALGTFAGFLGRRIGIRPQWSATTRRRGWIGLALVSLIAIAVYMVRGARWQSEMRALFGMPEVDPSFALIFFVATALFLTLLLIYRGLRYVFRRLARLLDRWIPTAVAHSVSAVLVVVAAVMLFNGTIVDGTMGWLNDTYETRDRDTEPGVLQPTAAERSGSQASPVPWESLGFQGRSFVAGGPTLDELAQIADAVGLGGEVVMPIRVYAGLDPDADLEETAEVVVSELDRTGAWDRSVLVVVTTTGTGWVPPAAMEALELMHRGDTAVAAMQYSFLPSWVSWAADRETPPAAAKTLFEAVYERWAELDESSRPRLVVYGESLGSYGGQGAFSGIQDMTTRTGGALWVGTPNFTHNWRFLTDSRDPGSPEYRPVYEGGRQVRWGTGRKNGPDLWDLGPEWDEPRVVYLQNPSDGVVWWSPDLILNQPDWLREPLGPGVIPGLRWVPVVTFWQVTLDALVAGQMPPGHGHNYLADYVDGWAAVTSPEGWSERATTLLQEVIVAKYGGEPEPQMVPEPEGAEE